MFVGLATIVAATTTAPVVAGIAPGSVETSATAAAATTTSATTATAGSAIFAGTGFVDCQRPTVEVFPVETRNDSLGIRVGPHRDEGKSARTPGEFILHQHDFRDGAVL